MGDFFGDLGKYITGAAEEVTKKAEETIEVQKIKSQIRSLKRGNERDYQDIGKMIYEQFQAGELVDSDCVELCETIEKREKEIAKQMRELERR